MQKIGSLKPWFELHTFCTKIRFNSRLGIYNCQTDKHSLLHSRTLYLFFINKSSTEISILLFPIY